MAVAEPVVVGSSDAVLMAPVHACVAAADAVVVGTCSLPVLYRWASMDRRLDRLQTCYCFDVAHHSSDRRTHRLRYLLRVVDWS